MQMRACLHEVRGSRVAARAYLVIFIDIVAPKLVNLANGPDREALSWSPDDSS
jgi:hypothetical protein